MSTPSADDESSWPDYPSLDGLRDVLRPTLCHITNQRGADRIRECGEIRVSDGSVWGAGCYAHWRGAVALFDFERATDRQMRQQWRNAVDHVRKMAPTAYALVLDRAHVGDLITYDEAMIDDPRRQRRKIPYLEVWSVSPIPVAAISRVLRIETDRALTPRVRFTVHPPDDFQLTAS